MPFHPESGFHFATLNLSAFNNLEKFILSEVKLRGSIPPEIGTLTKLSYIDLSYNLLAGELPSSLANLSLLQHLSLFSNNIPGSIPSEIGFLKNLITLDLSYNRISVPSSITIYKSHTFGRARHFQ